MSELSQLKYAKLWDNLLSSGWGPPAESYIPKDVELLETLIQRVDEVHSIADIGCGKGDMLFFLARKYPHLEFVGFDIAGSIIDSNIGRARAEKLKNLLFKVAFLPELREIGDTFDIVACMRTLHYLEDLEKSLKRLYEMVDNRGYLMFNYPNLYGHYRIRKAYRNSDDEERSLLERLYKNYLLGQNLVTQKRIERILKAKIEKLYTTGRHNIILAIKKR